jgi:hypothetical protein
MSKKLRPSVPNPVVAEKEQYYKRKTELVEEELRKKKREEEEFELDVARKAELHAKQLLLLVLQIEKLKNNSYVIGVHYSVVVQIRPLLRILVLL